jgi:hypothetical protein
MAIAYSASTAAATFLLDEQGICRRVLLKRASSNDQGNATLGGRSRSAAAKLVVGAQYVASIDTRVEGGLVPMPRPGAAMLFAYADESGRLAVVRTAPLVKFETVAEPDDTVPVPDLDDECMTIPLHQSGERITPRWLFDPLPGGGGGAPPAHTTPSARDQNPTRDALEETLEAPVPGFRRASWPGPQVPIDPHVRLRKVSIVQPNDVGPTQKFERAPPGRGMLPKKPSRAQTRG